MTFDASTERSIRSSLAAGNYTGRWEGRTHGWSISIWIEGERGSRRVCFTAAVRSGTFTGAGVHITEVLDRIDAAIRERTDSAEAWMPAPTDTAPTPRRIRINHQNAPTRPNANGNGTRHTLMGFGLCKVLQWMGAHGFNQYDAINALEHHGLSEAISKKTISRAMDKGRNPERDGIDIINLPDDVIAALEPFRDLAKRTG